MKKNEKVFFFCILGFLLIAFLIIQQILISKQTSSDELILKKLQNIEIELNNISNKKDSIRVVINTIDREIIKNEKHYEEITNNIIAQPSSMDSLFITEFIDRFIETEGSKYNLYPVRETEH